MISEQLVINRLYEISAVKTGHFELRSKNHSDTYIHKDAILCNENAFSSVLMAMQQIVDVNIEELTPFHFVTGPPAAGTMIASPMSVQLSKSFIYPEKIIKVDELGVPISEDMILRRGFDRLISNRRILLFEDIITTGSSVMKLVELIENCNGRIAGVICIWNRTNWKNPEFPVYSIVNKEVIHYAPGSDTCPMCRDNVPFTDPKA